MTQNPGTAFIDHTVCFQKQESGQTWVRIHPDGRGRIRPGQIHPDQLDVPDWHLLFGLPRTVGEDQEDGSRRNEQSPA